MKFVFLSPVLVLLLGISFRCAAQQAGADEALQQQLTTQERAEYQQRLNQASGEQERREINAQYRKKVEDRTGLRSAGEDAQPRTGAPAEPAHANPAATRSGPAGSKSKPQKHGH